MIGIFVCPIPLIAGDLQGHGGVGRSVHEVKKLEAGYRDDHQDQDRTAVQMISSMVLCDVLDGTGFLLSRKRMQTITSKTRINSTMTMLMTCRM